MLSSRQKCSGDPCGRQVPHSIDGWKGTPICSGTPCGRQGVLPAAPCGRQAPTPHITLNKPLLIAALLVFVLSTAGAASSFLGYQSYKAKYRTDMILVRTGAAHLRSALTLLQALPKKPLDGATVQQAHQEFAAASTTFVQLDLNLAALPEFITAIPEYGSRLNSALRLVPIAIEAAQLGIIGCDAFNGMLTRLHAPLGTGLGFTMNDMQGIERNVQQIKMLFQDLVAQVALLSPGDVQFDPQMSKVITSFNQNIPLIQNWLDEVEKLLPVLPDILGIGHPSHYLIEMLDSTELRPGGGFIGNYGIATLSNGRLTEAHVTDVYLFDRPFENAGHRLPFPPAYTWFSHYQQLTSWNLRDSNLDADFPTTARNAERNYQLEGGNVPVQGVIAITPAFISHMLQITGPIFIPEYAETITSQNLISRIHYHQLGPGREGEDVPAPDGHSSIRKHFTELLAEHFLAQVRQLSASALPKFWQVVQHALSSRDIQLYLNAPLAEDFLHRTAIDGAIAAPPGDSLFVVDANVAGDKANAFITNTLSDQVTLDAEGNATHHTTLTYAWLSRGNVYGNPLYKDYLRIYVPPGSSVQMQSGWQPLGTSQAFGREVWAGLFTLMQGQTRTLTFVWTVMHAAQKDAHGWHYQYLVQHQAGTRWNLHLQIALPLCAGMKNTGSGSAPGSGQVKQLDRVLDGDVSMGIGYMCR